MGYLTAVPPHRSVKQPINDSAHDLTRDGKNQKGKMKSDYFFYREYFSTQNNKFEKCIDSKYQIQDTYRQKDVSLCANFCLFNSYLPQVGKQIARNLVAQNSMKT